MSIITVNGVAYDTEEFRGYKYLEVITAGTGEQLERFFALIADLMADASRARITTSATSKDAGLSGVQGWVLAADVSFALGSSVRIARASDPANTYYDGVVTGYVSGTKTLSVLVKAAAGSATGATDWTVSVSGAIGPIGPAGNRNRLINGSMAVDQRMGGNGQALTNSTQYAVDRWFAITAGADMTSRRVATGLPDFPFATRLQRAGGSLSASTVYLGQIVESANCQDMAGQQATLSFYAQAGANFSSSGGALAVQLLSGTGTDQGAASLNSGSWTGLGMSAINATATLTGSRTRYSFTGTVPAGARELAARFHWTPSGTAGADDYCDVTGVQLEIGVTPTSFERRQASTELALCQRYYEKSFAIGTVPAQNVGVTAGALIAPQVVTMGAQQQVGSAPFKATKRVAPAMTLYNPSAANAQVRNTIAGADCSSSNVAAGENGFNVSAITPMGGAMGNALVVHWAADAELN